MFFDLKFNVDPTDWMPFDSFLFLLAKIII